MSERNVQSTLDLPEPLPEDESLIWLGQPDPKRLALQVFHLRLVALYFAVLAGWRAIATWSTDGIAQSVIATAWTLVPAVATIGILLLLAWLSSRSAVYAITNKRLILKIGIALPLTINLPFSRIDSAALKAFADGTGDIAIVLRSGGRLGYAVLWPHARPWHVRQPQPMLRAVPEAEQVARHLARAVSASEAEVRTPPRAARIEPVAASSRDRLAVSG
jgi:hypothetical protein